MSVVHYSEKAEQIVLGCFMVNPEATRDLIETTLTAKDFFSSAHQHIFTCLFALLDAGKSLESSLVHYWLSERKLDKECGSPGYLADLMTSYENDGSVRDYIEIVKEKSMARSLHDACHRAQMALMDGDPIAEIIDRISQDLFLISTHCKE